MIRSRLNQLRATGERVLPIAEVARGTGIARSTLFKLAAGDFDGVHSATVSTLCKYFGCGVGDLLEYVPETEEAK